MSAWISAALRVRRYTRTSSMRPWNHSLQIELPPIRSAPVELTSEPITAAARDLRAVHVEAQVGAVVGGGQVRPGVQRQRRRPARVELACSCRRARSGGWCRCSRRGRRRVPPVCSFIRAVRQPAAEVGLTHASSVMCGRQVERRGVGDRDPVVHAVEGERAAEAARRRAGGARDRARVALARAVGGRGARWSPRSRRPPRGRSGRRRRSRCWTWRVLPERSRATAVSWWLPAATERTSQR